MENKYVIAIFLVIFFVLVVAGVFLGEQGVDVAGCQAKWRITSVTAGKSDLCSADSCTASSADQQHNAIVEAVSCACARAESAQYADANANKRIEEVTQEFFGYALTTQQICGSEGQQFLVRRSYG